MTQFNAPIRRAGGELNVYTGLLCAAFLVLVAGVAIVAMQNIEHSSLPNQDGSMLKFIQK